MDKPTATRDWHEPKRSLPTEPTQPSVADLLLGSLERLVQRHRSLALYDGQHSGLHAELIAADVAHELAMARSQLYGHGRQASTRS
jgi:hypothetical protein